MRLLKSECNIIIRWRKNMRFWKMLVSSNFSGPMVVLPIMVLALVNRTEVEVRPTYLKIEHKPFDALPMVFYGANNFRQFFVRKTVAGDRDNVPEGTQGLFAKMTTGEDKFLLRNLKENTFLFIEEEIERVLKIKDE